LTITASQSGEHCIHISALSQKKNALLQAEFGYFLLQQFENIFGRVSKIAVPR